MGEDLSTDMRVVLTGGRDLLDQAGPIRRAGTP
jgi:hypothetical protein